MQFISIFIELTDRITFECRTRSRNIYFRHKISKMNKSDRQSARFDTSMKDKYHKINFRTNRSRTLYSFIHDVRCVPFGQYHTVRIPRKEPLKTIERGTHRLNK